MRTLLSLAALALAACATPPADPPAAPQAAAAQPAAVSPVGDWNGVLTIPNGPELRMGVTIEEISPGAYAATVHNPDQGAPPRQSESVAFADGKLEVRTTAATFSGSWDAATSSFIGEYAGRGGSFPLTLKSGPVPPVPPNPPIAGIDGRWEGAVMGIPLVLRIMTDTTGTLAFLDSPAQGTGNIPVPTITREADTVAFSIPIIGAAFSGTLAPEGDTIAGTFTQGGPIPLELRHVSADVTPAVAIARPQEPEKPYSYREEAVTVVNGDLSLPCTLTLPEGNGPYPAALLLSGSGAQDRDESLMGHRPFLIVADHLTRHGFAILRCDDRDYVRPRTDGEMSSLVTDFVTDANAALALLRTHADIDPKRIGLIGHSEGGVTAPRVAVDDPGVAFVITLAGVGARGRDTLLMQRELLMTSIGAPQETIDQTRAVFAAMFDAMLAAPDDAAAKAAAIAGVKALPNMPGMEDYEASDEDIDMIASQFASKYYRDLLAWDPAPVLARINVPFLALNGSKDVQVEAKQNLAGYKAGLAHNPDVTVIELPGLNHLFQTAPTGAITEYATIEETFAPAALTAMSDWLTARMKP